MGDRPHLAERFVAVLIGMAMALVIGIVRAPFIAISRLLWPMKVEEVAAGVVVDLRHQVLRVGRPRETAVFADDEAPGTRHFALRWGGEVVGVASVMEAPMPETEDGPRYQLRGMAIAPEMQGRGLGTRLLRAIQRAVGEPLWCNARVTAADFYAEHGWTVQSKSFDVPEVGPHVRMRWDRTLPAPR